MTLLFKAMMERCRDVFLLMRTWRPVIRPVAPVYLRMNAAEMRELPLAATLMFLVSCVLLLRLMMMLVRVPLVVVTIRRKVLRLLFVLRIPMSMGRVTLLDSLRTAVAWLDLYLIVEMWLPGPDIALDRFLLSPTRSSPMFLVNGELLTTEILTRALLEGPNMAKNLPTCLTGAQCYLLRPWSGLGQLFVPNECMVRLMEDGTVVGTVHGLPGLVIGTPTLPMGAAPLATGTSLLTSLLEAL